MRSNELEIEKRPAAEVEQFSQSTRLSAGYRYGQPPAYGYAYNSQGENDQAHLRELWRTVRKRKWLIISIVLIITSLVTVEMLRSKSVYRASATVEVGRESTTQTKSGNLVINEDADPQYQVNIKTKMVLLGSRELHEDVVASLKLDQNQKFLQPPGGISIKRTLKSLLGMTGDKSAAVDLKNIPEEALGELPPRSAQESARLSPYVEALKNNLAIEPLRETRAIRISFDHFDPVIAATVANGVARAFRERSFQSKTEKFTNTAEWLDRTTRELKAHVQEAEQALANYTRANNIFSINDDNLQQTTLTTEKLKSMHDQALRAQADRILKENLYREVQAGRIAQLPDAFADDNLKWLQKQLNELRAAAAQLAVKYSPRHPKMVEIQEQISAVERQISEGRSALEAKLRGDFNRALQDEKTIHAALDQTKSEAAEENQATIQYNILKQDLDTSRALYTDFLQKTNQAKAAIAEQYNEIRLIERAGIPEKPVGPMRALTILLALMISLGGSVAIVSFLEYIDNTIKNVDDVSRYIQLPALGVIPPINEGRRPRYLMSRAHTDGGAVNPGRLMALETRSTAAEAYRALRTSVLLSAAGKPPRTLLVTSSQPGEGKTTTVLNTAICLAQLGASVLVIDCDLRRPSAHKVLEVDHSRGVSTYLSGDVEVDDLIIKLQIANVSLLPSGPIPPNPAELVSSEKMRNLLVELSDKYDHILLDSPPLMNVTDPVILSRMVDGVILVVYSGKSTRTLVRRARQELLSVGAKISGVVLNNVDLKHEECDGYYYGDYYGEEPKIVGSEV